MRQQISEGMVGTYTEQDLYNLEPLTNLLSEKMIISGEDGNLKPNLIESWEVDKEAKNYQFILKEGLYWSDGSSVRSEDIYMPIPDAEITTPDERTIKFRLNDSYSPLPSLLTRPMLRKDALVGMGEYQITEKYFVNSDKVFISKVVVAPTKNKDLPVVVIRFYRDEKTAKNALKVGEVQSLFGVNEFGEFINQKPFAYTSKSSRKKLVTIFYNTKDPILSDENFRLALSYSAPKVKGEDIAKTSIPQLHWAFNDNVKEYLGNGEQAKLAFEKVENGKDSTIVLTATSSLKEVGERVVEEWGKIGVKAVLRVESGVPQNFQALLISYDLPPDPADQYSLWHSTQINTNISKYSFVRVDKDLEDARKTTDMEIRKARYQDFQKILLDHSPATFLYFPKINAVYLRKVGEELKGVLDLQIR